MNKKNLLKIISGTGQIIKGAVETVGNKSIGFFEDNIIKGKYVTREEYDTLSKLVVKLQEEITRLKNK